MVRGQFRGYRQEPGVAAGSQVETYAAVRLRIESMRWQGVPFYIRTGKCLPVTSTEVVDPPAAATNGVAIPERGSAAELLPVPHRPAADGRVRRHGDGRGRPDDRPARRARGEPAAGRRREGRLRAGLTDALEGDADAVRADGLRRRGLAHRRSGAGDEHAGSRIRAGHLGSGRSRR